MPAQTTHTKRQTTHHNGWTPERRARQALAIRRWRPWSRSTGPRTAAGKAIVRYNARKHGMRSFAWRDLMDALKMQREFVRSVNLALLILRLQDKKKNLTDKLMDCRDKVQFQSLTDKLIALEARYAKLLPSPRPTPTPSSLKTRLPRLSGTYAAKTTLPAQIPGQARDDEDENGPPASLQRVLRPARSPLTIPLRLNKDRPS
jgi:hypothetical protein